MRSVHILGVLGGALGFLSGCAIEAPTQEDVASTEQSIIDGQLATDPALDAVGAVVFRLAGYDFTDFYCTATLIAPKVALTARHCVTGDSAWRFDPVPEFSNHVVFGNTYESGKAEARIVSFVTAPPGPGGLLNDGGRDIAVLYLDSVPKGIKPVKLGHFEESMLGTQFRLVGFGWTENFTSGTKYEGVGTVRALAGDWYPLLFDNDFAAFDAWYWTDAALALPSAEEEALWWTPGTYSLEPGYEALVGGLAGESVTCYGDSGGPLLRGTSAKKMTTYGVSFAGEATYSKACGLGSGYAVLNDEMFDFVQGAVEDVQ